MDSLLPLWPVTLWIGVPVLLVLFKFYRDSARDGQLKAFFAGMGYGLLFIVWFLGAIYLAHVLGD